MYMDGRTIAEIESLSYRKLRYYASLSELKFKAKSGGLD